MRCLRPRLRRKKAWSSITVGVGTAAGELIPIPDSAGGTEFVKDPDGNFVKSRLDSDMLTPNRRRRRAAYIPRWARKARGS